MGFGLPSPVVLPPWAGAPGTTASLQLQRSCDIVVLRTEVYLNSERSNVQARGTDSNY